MDTKDFVAAYQRALSAVAGDLIKASPLSFNKLAAVLPMSASTLKRIANHGKALTLEQLLALAAHFDMTPTEFNAAAEARIEEFRKS